LARWNESCCLDQTDFVITSETSFPQGGIGISQLDRAGLPDLVLGGATGVRVIPRDDDGGSGRAQGFGTDGTPAALALADMDGNGWTDIVTANESTNTLS